MNICRYIPMYLFFCLILTSGARRSVKKTNAAFPGPSKYMYYTLPLVELIIKELPLFSNTGLRV